MPDEPIISCKGVVKRFGERPTLAGVDVDIYPGETMIIMGGSGSGKSTLLKLMTGGLAPEEGSVKLFGKDLATLARMGRAEELDDIRKRFGVLFQSGALFNSMTIAENVALPLSEHTELSPDIIDIQVKIKLELVGLREHAHKYPAQISGGMKKRAGLARALALDPQILFYDEPSAGLDPVTSAQLDQLIVALTRQLGVTSVVVTHEMDSAFTIADRLAMLDRGRMIKVETKAWYDELRTCDDKTAEQRPEVDQLIRQFLRGDHTGPLTARRSLAAYEEDLLGWKPAPDTMPSVQATRGA